MDITFHSKKLQKVCSREKEMLKTHGKRRARKLMQRLMELQAADHLAQIPNTPPPRCHELSGNMKGIFSVDLEHPWRLLFVPTHKPAPRKSDGGIDLEKVTEIVVIGIEDTH